MIKYSEKQISSVFNSNVGVLCEDTINIINFLAHKVGAPTYKKTPNFKKRHSVVDKITGEDWAAIRNFKTTVMKKNTEGILKEIDEIRCLLNKVTDSLFDETLVSIMEKLKKCKDEFSIEEFKKIGKIIFDIGSKNKWSSFLYAKVYKRICLDYPIFNDISNDNFNSYSKIFETINYIDPDEDYSLYCDYNKENEIRKSTGLFFVNLMKCQVFDEKKIAKLIINLINKINENLILKNKKEVIDELVSNLIILVEKTKHKLKNSDSWTTIENHIVKMSNEDKNNFESFSMKIKFKYIDLVEGFD